MPQFIRYSGFSISGFQFYAPASAPIVTPFLDCRSAAWLSVSAFQRISNFFATWDTPVGFNRRNNREGIDHVQKTWFDRIGGVGIRLRSALECRHRSHNRLQRPGATATHLLCSTAGSCRGVPAAAGPRLRLSAFIRAARPLASSLPVIRSDFAEVSGQRGRRVTR